jgi:hypothetical protein
VQDDGKYASKRATKAIAVNCAVLPIKNNGLQAAESSQPSANRFDF